MKKALALILAAGLLLLYVGCAPQTEQPNPVPDTDVTEQENETKNDNYAEPDGTTDPNTITADEKTEEPTPDTDEVADDGENTLELNGTVTVTSMDELKKYTDANLVSDSLYNYLYSFLVDGWEFPEVNDEVEISDYSITFTIPFDSVKGFDVYFTVSKSTLSTLPVGEYHRIFAAGMDFDYINDPDQVKDDRYEDIPEVEKLVRFICVNLIWNTPVFGEGTTYPGAYDFIHCFYGDYKNGCFILDYDEFCRIAKEEFGITDTRPLFVTNVVSDDDTCALLDTIYFPPVYDVMDAYKNSEGTFVTIQLYADREKLTTSHKIRYCFDQQGHFNGYEILEEGKYEPWGLKYYEDNGTIIVIRVKNLMLYVKNGLFDEEQYDFYCDFLEEHRGYIYDYTISFKLDQDKSVPFESYIDFEVADSKLDTLPDGEYHRKLVSGEVMSFEDVDPSETAKVIIGETQTH